jgi:uncharacterized membrane protein
VRANNAPPKFEGAGRAEAFSDGVLAIIVTLLIFELHVPQLADLSNRAVLSALWVLAPKLVSFGVSFFTVAIFWVNHHHFFRFITHTNWKLLWANNLLLFWLAIVPFTTAFVGDYPGQPLVVALYAVVLGLAALSFTLMGYYVFFKSDLVRADLPLERRRHEFNRSWVGAGLYGLAALIALFYVPAALIIMTLLPFFYVVPNLLSQSPE